MTLSMNHIELAPGQKAYAPVACPWGGIEELRIVVVNVMDRGTIVAKVPQFGADYGLVYCDPTKTFVVES